MNSSFAARGPTGAIVVKSGEEQDEAEAEKGMCKMLRCLRPQEERATEKATDWDWQHYISPHRCSKVRANI